MKILAVLWTVSLVGLCSAFWCCGGSETHDDEVTVITVQGGSKKASTGNLRSTPPQHSIAPAGQFSSEDSPVSQSFGQPITTTPVTLDLAKPDKGIDVNVCSQSGMSFKEYTPKDAFHISSVMDGWNWRNFWVCNFLYKGKLYSHYHRHKQR